MPSKIFLFVGLLFISFFLILANTDSGEVNAINVSSIKNILSQTDEDLAESVDTVLVEMKTKGIELSYSVSEIRAKAGDVLHIKYSNESDMSHNIVFVNGEKDIRPVGIAAPQAMSTNWIPKTEMNRILAHSELVYSGEIAEIYIKVPPPGTYPYICTYSAHWTQMQGRLISE